MKNLLKLFFILLVSSFASCSTNDSDNTFQSYHLIDSYYETENAAVVANRNVIEISFVSNYLKGAYHSREYAQIAGINQSEASAAKFIELAEANNDFHKWQVPYTTVGGTFSKAYSNTALVSGIAGIELTSDADYDETHPRGTSLTNMITLLIDSYGEHIGKDLTGTDTASNLFGEKKKSYRSFTQQELSVVGPWMTIYIDKLPTLAIKHNLKLTITFNNGDQFEKLLSVSF